MIVSIDCHFTLYLLYDQVDQVAESEGFLGGKKDFEGLIYKFGVLQQFFLIYLAPLLIKKKCFLNAYYINLLQILHILKYKFAGGYSAHRSSVVLPVHPGLLFSTDYYRSSSYHDNR